MNEDARSKNEISPFVWGEPDSHVGPVMATGTVKWFSIEKGYGYIQPENNGPHVFVHISAVEQAGMQSLIEGQKLSYEVVAGMSSAGNLKLG